MYAKITQVATGKILKINTVLIENSVVFAKFRSVHCQFASLDAQSNRLCYIDSNLGEKKI